MDIMVQDIITLQQEVFLSLSVILLWAFYILEIECCTYITCIKIDQIEDRRREV